MNKHGLLFCRNCKMKKLNGKDLEMFGCQECYQHLDHLLYVFHKKMRHKGKKPFCNINVFLIKNRLVFLTKFFFMSKNKKKIEYSLILRNKILFLYYRLRLCQR